MDLLDLFQQLKMVIYTFYTTSTIYGTFISDYTIISTLPNIIYSTLHPVFIRECSERSSKEVFYPAVFFHSFNSTGFLLVLSLKDVSSITVSNKLIIFLPFPILLQCIASHFR